MEVCFDVFDEVIKLGVGVRSVEAELDNVALVLELIAKGKLVVVTHYVVHCLTSFAYNFFVLVGF